ncbi:uncharacterized protein LOC132706530 isoform X2 [Cylas formicarius]|uniref:uncharacterized protein LOC132706530 isoform X2 n=1 Tax=Cylas formicarius TaxID=197179 RepID=UPI0029585C7D|nr:uncharacterized protein LOC132706530 isoform X2 [Cylas formicarius]
MDTAEESSCWLLLLSDCVMLKILSYLDATSLFLLNKTCTYFENIVKDKQLWKYVDTTHEPNTDEKVQYCCDRLHKDTTHLFLKAHSRQTGVVIPRFFKQLPYLKNLTVLSLENQQINGKFVSMNTFPSQLEELSLRGTNVKCSKLFFQYSSDSKQNLKVLILDGCNWIHSSFIMSVSKYPKLEIISVVKCNKLHHNILPYLPVTRYGCKNLKVMDCRFSTVANDFLRVFSQNGSVLGMYFHSMRTHELDYGAPFLKKLDKLRKLSVEDKLVIVRNIIENGVLADLRFNASDLVEEFPESVLYKDPYPECTCKYQERELPDASGKLAMDIDDFIDFRSAAPDKFLCRNHMKDVQNLSAEFRNFFCHNQQMFHSNVDSGTDSDYDSDADCCVYGMGKTHNIFVLKMRDTDHRGNLPEPEVISLHDNDRGPGGSIGDAQVRESVREPSTSAARADVKGKSKRKLDLEEQRSKKMKIDRVQHETQKGVNRSELEDSLRRNEGPSTSGTMEQTSPQHNDSDNQDSDKGKPRPGAEEIPAAGNEPLVFRRNDLIAILANPRQYQEENDKKLKLRRLSLRGYRMITDAALSYIKNLNIDLLDVTYTAVTREGVEQFLAYNPKCRVIHKDFCVCRPRIFI